MRPTLLFTILFALPALADLRVQWLAPESCADHPPVAELAPGAEGRAEVQLREEAGRWVVTVLFFEPEQGLRRVTTSTCAEAVSTASLLLKLGSEGAELLKAPPSPPTVVLRPPEKTVPADGPWHFALKVGSAFDIGSFPTVEPRVAFNVSAFRRLVRIELDARIGLPRELMTNVSAMRVVELQAAGCVNWSWHTLTVAPCLAASAGTWSVDATWGKSRTVMTAAGSAQLRVAALLLPGPGLELGALGGVRVNLARPQVILDGSTISQMPLVSGDLQLALGWRW